MFERGVNIYLGHESQEGVVIGAVAPIVFISYLEDGEDIAETWDEMWPDWRDGMVLFLWLDPPRKPMTLSELLLNRKVCGLPITEHLLETEHDKLDDVEIIATPSVTMDEYQDLRVQYTQEYLERFRGEDEEEEPEEEQE